MNNLEMLYDRAQSACQSCHMLTDELGAAMYRIETLATERDAARELVRDLRVRLNDLRVEA